MAKIAQIKVENSNNNSNVLEFYAPITKIGIQADSGTTFYFNNMVENEIIMGQYGIYELDLTNLGYINSLVFTNLSEGKYAYVDIVYHGEGGEQL